MRRRIAPLIESVSPKQRIEFAVFVLQMMRRSREATQLEFDLLLDDLREVACISPHAWGDGPREL